LGAGFAAATARQWLSRLQRALMPSRKAGRIIGDLPRPGKPGCLPKWRRCGVFGTLRALAAGYHSIIDEAFRLSLRVA
jgi:hypothetical protein